MINRPGESCRTPGPCPRLFPLLLTLMVGLWQRLSWRLSPSHRRTFPGALPAQCCGRILSVEHKQTPWLSVLMKDASILRKVAGLGGWGLGCKPPLARRSVLWALQRLLSVSCCRGWGGEGTPLSTLSCCWSDPHQHPVTWDLGFERNAPTGLGVCSLESSGGWQGVPSMGFPLSQQEQEWEALSRCLPPLPLWMVRGELPTDLPHPHPLGHHLALESQPETHQLYCGTSSMASCGYPSPP